MAKSRLCPSPQPAAAGALPIYNPMLLEQVVYGAAFLFAYSKYKINKAAARGWGVGAGWGRDAQGKKAAGSL